MGIEMKFGNDRVMTCKDKEGNPIFYNKSNGEQGTMCLMPNGEDKEAFVVYKGDLYAKKFLGYDIVATEFYK